MITSKNKTFNKVFDPVTSLFRIYPMMRVDMPTQGYIHCSTVCTNEKSETIQMFIIRGVHKLWCITKCSTLLSVEKKEKSAHTLAWKGIQGI